jgi:hypothetical protein
LAKGEENPGYGEPLTLVSGGALVAFIGWSLSPLVSDLRLFLFLVLYLGLGLAALEIFFWRWPPFWREKDLKAAVKKFAQSHQPLLASLILALIFSFFYSAIWESGQMDVWLFGSVDQLNWAMCADFWLGSVDPATIPLTYKFILMTRDSFGTLILHALWALAANQSSLYSACSFMLTMVIWSGLSIQALARKIFGLGFWLSLAITLGVIGGGFYSYLISKGLVGQLVATMAYLVALKEIFHWPASERLGRVELTHFFLPVFFIFLAYQGGFAAYAFFIALAIMVRHFCLSENQAWLKRGLDSILAGVRLITLSGLAAALMSPFLAWHLWLRTVQSAHQAWGWKIALISPWLMSGLPVYRPQYFTTLDSQPSIAWLGLFITVVLAFGLWANQLSTQSLSTQLAQLRSSQTGKSLSTGIDVRLINSVIVIFLISIIMYIIGYYVFDNRYQVWKFISYVGLPLSFVPLALLVLVIKQLTGPKVRVLTLSGLLILSITFGFGIENLKNLTKIPRQYYNIMSASSFLNAIKNIVSTSDPKTHFIFNFKNPADIFFITELFKNNKINKLSLLNKSLYFMNSDVWQIILNNDSKYLLISDVEYDILYNNSRGQSEVGSLYVNDKSWVTDHGFVDIRGLDRERNWLMVQDWILLRILVPKSLAGQDLRLSVSLRGSVDNSAACEPLARLGFPGQSGSAALGNFQQVEILVEKALTERGLITAAVHLEEGQRSELSEQCRYFFDKVDLSLVN